MGFHGNIFFLQCYNLFVNYYLLCLFQLDKSNISPKTPYDRKGTFDICKETNSTSNSNIFFADLIDLEDVHFYEWAWIFPFLILLQLFLYVLQHKGKIEIFGPSITYGQFWNGRLPNTESHANSSSENIQGIIFTNLVHFNFKDHFSNFSS